VDIRQVFFKYRSYTPIPLVILALIFAKPTGTTFWSGLCVMLCGEAIRFWGVAYAGSTTRTTTTAGGDRLITDGPFAYVRNPLYVGNFFLSAGYLIMSWAWMPWMIGIYLPLFAFQYGMIVHLEEAYLAERFHSLYEEYQKQVNRWIPRVRPYRGKDRSLPRYAHALRSERTTFLTILLVWTLLLIRWRLL